MYLTRHQTPSGPRWAADGCFLPPSFTLSFLLEMSRDHITRLLADLPRGKPAEGIPLLPPAEPMHEVWGCGVTYLRSRSAREEESKSADVYTRVYEAERPEVFFKGIGWRVVGHGMPIRIRHDSQWNVPEPELTLVINAHREIVGYCVGNDVSSRDIEGANPLYLSQAKVYNGSCAIGPGIQLTSAGEMRNLPTQMEIVRKGETIFQGDGNTSQMKRTLEELVHYLTLEMDFPHGLLAMTGTNIIPPHDFTLQVGDLVCISIGSLTLKNEVQS